MPVRLVAVATSMLVVGRLAAAGEIEFRHVLDNSPLDITPKPGEQFSPAVAEFHRTGRNPYNADSEAVADGKKLYDSICQACHMADGSGRIGPSFIDGRHIYPRITTDVGLFEVVFGGATGAMQPFSKRLVQDQILKVMAYMRISFLKE